MNARDPNPDGLARLHYGDCDYVVLKPGRFVVCAVTARQIPLDALRYWSIDLQEAYVGPAELMERAAAA
ncbi:DUF2093 domain-containing protein [Brevundimonas sp.]|uniref:DUF2093 domain-containing protein n=1 Tax=Brevundimonas sp. TaxID=1871086 RepID=UPI001D6E2893|nr:DUF2093 domain-containing protein [Brevundimonas sp.]MBA4000172.1 DUF2093 domain-containing protein [Brevundimonas sp.]